MNLHQIGLKYGTDKATHASHGISFLSIYETYLQHRRDEAIKILDIGILRGSSVKTFKEYFKNATIVGLDIDPTCAQYMEDRINIFIGSQDDPKFAKFFQTAYGGFDIIIDDASHVNELTIKSFDLYWPLLNNNGIYIIEDTHCCYHDLTESIKSWPGMEYNKDGINYDNSNGSFDAFVSRLARMISIGPSDGLFNISFFQGTLVITKKN